MNRRINNRYKNTNNKNYNKNSYKASINKNKQLLSKPTSLRSHRMVNKCHKSKSLLIKNKKCLNNLKTNYKNQRLMNRVSYKSSQKFKNNVKVDRMMRSQCSLSHHASKINQTSNTDRHTIKVLIILSFLNRHLYGLIKRKLLIPLQLKFIQMMKIKIDLKFHLFFIFYIHSYNQHRPMLFFMHITKMIVVYLIIIYLTIFACIIHIFRPTSGQEILYQHN